MEQLAEPGSDPPDGRDAGAGRGLRRGEAARADAGEGLAEPVEVYELPGAGAARTRLQAAAARGLRASSAATPSWSSSAARLSSSRRRSGPGRGARRRAGRGQVAPLLRVHPLASRCRAGWSWRARSVSYGRATSYLPVIDLLKGYFRSRPGRPPRESARRYGQAAHPRPALEPTLPALLALLDVPVDEAAWQALDPAQRRQRTLDAVNACSCGRARSSRCCWSSRISTGSTPRRRRCSTAWSRACRPPASSCS